MGPEVLSFFDDGIAEDEYPSPVAWRGEGYPEALAMVDWVWDRVGPQWAVVLFSERSESSNDQDTSSLPSPVAYLVSPEGVYFELSELPPRVSDGATLVSWHEEERQARIVWSHATKGGLLHLETGEVEDTSFQMNTERTKEVQFLGSNAAGKEVWTAWSADLQEERFFAWTSEGGWEQVLTGQNDLYIEWFTIPTSGDGSAVAFQIYTEADSLRTSKRSLPPGKPNLVVYSIDSGENHRYIPGMPPGDSECWFTGWIDPVSVGYSCWNDEEGVQNGYRVLVDGSNAVFPYEAVTPWFSNVRGDGTARHPDAPIELVTQEGDGTLQSVRVLMGDDVVTVIDAATHLGNVGREILSFEDIEPGVFRMVTGDGIVIGIDTTTATIGPTIVAATPDGISLMPRSYVFFKEPTPPGVGIEWGD